MSRLSDYQRVIAYYGDDFTGSTDVMEALTVNGLPAVLFFEPPNDGRLARFPACRAVGVAGTSRSRSPEWMKQHLRPVFERLKELGTPVVHYKICSTFDSSPEVGNIGCAIEIGREVFGSRYVPLVVGAPVLGRYTVFGNHFAAGGGEVHRLDRHPTMSRHPVTPMDEADLRIHLKRQAGLSAGLIDILALRSKPEQLDRRFDEVVSAGPDVVLFDVLDDASLVPIGRLLWERRAASGPFVAGSSGLEYALAAYWRSAGELPAAANRFDAGPVDRLIVVSGSCAPVTAQQIRTSFANGFDGLRLDVRALARGDAAAIEEAVEAGLQPLGRGRSVVLYTALGPDDPALVEPSLRTPEFNAALGRSLGTILLRLIERSGVRRVVVCGGDTSGHAGNVLGVYALTMAAPMAPGSPLCRAHSDNPQLDRLEVVFKGGQNGNEQLFSQVRQGRAR